MVRSQLDNEVNYREDRTLFEEDLNYETFLYEAELHNTNILIALGQAKHEYNENDIVYYPIYLVTKDTKKIHAKIGVYEVSVSDAAVNVDEDGEPDVSLLDEPLIFSFVTQSYLKKSIPKTVDSKHSVVSNRSNVSIQKSDSKSGSETEMNKEEVIEYVDKVISMYGDSILEINMKDFRNKMYEVSGKTKSDFRKWKAFVKDYVHDFVRQKEKEMEKNDEQQEDEIITTAPVPKYIREPVPSDGWCSMHAVDQFLKHVGVFNEIPGNNEVPLSLKELAVPDNIFVSSSVQKWMEKFLENQKLWNADFGDGNHSTPDAACEYIKMKTRDNYECLRNVFTMGKDTLPQNLRNNSEFTVEEVKNIINTNSQMLLIRENPDATSKEETDKYAEDQQLVIFINTGNHWEIIYSPDIPKAFFETAIPTSTKSPSPQVVKIGSKVKWTKNGKIFEGEIVKITPKSYKICCKPNKTREEANSLYMIPKGNVSLNK